MRYRCCWCAPAPAGFEFTDRNGTGQCPKCCRPPGHGVYRLSDVHFIVERRGPIPPSQSGAMLSLIHGVGLQAPSSAGSFIACQPRRDALAMHRKDDFAATPDPRPVTCPACQRTKVWQEAAVVFPAIAPVLAAAREGREFAFDAGRGPLP